MSRAHFVSRCKKATEEKEQCALLTSIHYLRQHISKTMWYLLASDIVFEESRDIVSYRPDFGVATRIDEFVSRAHFRVALQESH